MQENTKEKSFFRLTFGRVLIIIMAAAVLVQIALMNRLLEENKLRDQKIAQQEAQIKELKKKLQIKDAIKEHQMGLSSEEITQLADVIYLESKRYVFDPLLIMAVIMTESSFKKNQVSDYGAQGLMQIMPSTAEGVARRMGLTWPSEFGLHDPALNVRLGVNYLFELILKFGSLKRGMLAYNMGESVLSEYDFYKAEPPPAFYNKVVKNYRTLKSKYGDAVR